jgi:hypothetical protein
MMCAEATVPGQLHGPTEGFLVDGKARIEGTTHYLNDVRVFVIWSLGKGAGIENGSRCESRRSRQLEQIHHFLFLYLQYYLVL